MIFPALRRKKKTQKRNQPLSYWIEGWFYLTIEFFNIYYGFLNLLAILNSLMVLFKESICPGVKVLISSTILRSISGFWLSEAKNSSGVISKYLQVYRKPSIKRRKLYRNSTRPQTHGIAFIELDQCIDRLWVNDLGIEHLLCDYIEVRGVKIPVFNTRLAEALNV